MTHFVGTTSYPPRGTVTGESSLGVHAMALAATNYFVAMFCPSERRGGDDDRLGRRRRPLQYIAVVFGSRHCVLPRGDSLVSANIENIVIVNPVAKFVLETFVLALTDSPAVISLSTFGIHTFADVEIVTHFVRNTINALQACPGGLVRLVDHLWRGRLGGFARTPGAVATVDFFHCMARQFVKLTPKSATVLIAAYLVFAGIGLRLTGAATTITTVIVFQVTARVVHIHHADPIVARATLASRCAFTFFMSNAGPSRVAETQKADRHESSVCHI